MTPATGNHVLRALDDSRELRRSDRVEAQRGARLGGNGWPHPDRLIEAERDDGEPSDGVIAAWVIGVMLGTIIAVVAALWIGSAIASALVRPDGCEALTAHECSALLEARQ